MRGNLLLKTTRNHHPPTPSIPQRAALERSLLFALSKGVVEISPRLVIWSTITVHIVVKSPSSASILDVTECLRGRHIWNITWKHTQVIGHSNVPSKGAARLFTCYRGWMFIWESILVSGHIPVMWKIVWSHLQLQEIWRTIWEYTQVNIQHIYYT